MVIDLGQGFDPQSELRSGGQVLVDNVANTELLGPLVDPFDLRGAGRPCLWGFVVGLLFVFLDLTGEQNTACGVEERRERDDPHRDVEPSSGQKRGGLVELGLPGRSDQHDRDVQCAARAGFCQQGVRFSSRVRRACSASMSMEPSHSG